VYKNFREAKDFETLLGELAATDDDDEAAAGEASASAED
jgi:hypothetical protein